MADDKAAEPAENGREGEKPAEPKKEFGILAARFLQKGKSSPTTTTGEYEALTAEQKAAQAPEPASGEEKKTLKAPIRADIDDDDDEPGESFMAHSASLGLGESLYSDGTEEVYDLDAGAGSEPPPENVVEIDLETIEDAGAETAYEIAEPEEHVAESQSEPEYEIQEPVEETPAAHEEPTAEPEYETAEPQYTVPEPEDETAPPQYAVPEPEDEIAQPQYAVPEPEYETAQPPQYALPEPEYETEPPQYAVPEPEDETAQPPQYALPEQEYETAPQYALPESMEEVAEADSVEEPVQPEYAQAAAEVEYEAPPIYQEAVEEPSYEAEETPVETAPYEPVVAFDPGVLDQIGVKSDESTISSELLDQIGTKNEAPQKKGLLGKFAAKKESRGEESRMIDLNALKAKKAEGGYDAAALDQIGAKNDSAAESKPYDSSLLDQIGTKKEAAAYDPSALDQIGFKKDSVAESKPYDASILDQIGVRADSKPYDPGVLDDIGIKKADTSTNENKIFVDPSEVQEGEKPAKGGLLGGKFGQKAKTFSSDKAKLGSIQNDPSVDQKETGRFMIDTPVVARDVEEMMPEPLTEMMELPSEEPPVEEEVHEPPPSIPGDEIGRLIADADAAFKLRQFRQAEPIYTRALEKLDKIGTDNDPRLVYLLDKSGDNLNELKKHKEALPIFRRLLILHEKVSSQDRDIISTLYKIARTSENLNLTGEADSMYKRAFRLGQQSLVPGDPLLAKVLEGYGTMLMRSEGSEPPAAEKPKEAPKSTLSPDEIKMLSELNIKAEAEGGAAPIVLGAGGAELGSLPQRESKKAALRETDERVEKMRAKGEGRPMGSGAVVFRVIVFFVAIFAFAQVINSMSIDYSRPKPFVFKAGPYNGFVYHTIEGAALITFFDNQHGTRSYFGQQTRYDYAPWNGKPADDWEVLSGKIGADNFAYVIPEGLKDTKGVIYYEEKAPENVVVANMRDLGKAVSDYYKIHKKYPDNKDLPKVVKIDYKNPFHGDDNVTARSIAWPAKLDAKQLFVKGPFDIGLENGDTWEGEPGGNGVITGISSQNKSPAASVFYVHGRDRHGNLLRRVDGKVFFLSFKNGLELTPGALINGEPKPPKNSVPLRVTSLGTVNLFTVILSYMPAFGSFIAFAVFLALHIRRKVKHTQGPSVAPFGSIWAAVMVVLCTAPKFAPDPYDDYAVYAAIVVFILGAAWIVFSIRRYLPNKPKTAKAAKAPKKAKPKKGPKPVAQPMATALEKAPEVPAEAQEAAAADDDEA